MQSIKITLKLLEALAADRQGLSVLEISRRLSFSKSTTHRALQDIAQEGFAVFDPLSQRYHQGPKLTDLALSFLSTLDIKFLAEPLLQRIFDLVNESVYLCVYSNQVFYFLDKIESSHPVRYVNPLGRREWIHAGAPGKAVMAYLPDEEVDRIIARGLPALTSNTITDPEKLKLELAKTRREGRAISFSEYAYGGWGLAAPLLDQRPYPYGCISIIIPEDRYDPSRTDYYSKLVKDSTRDLMDQMNRAGLRVAAM